MTYVVANTSNPLGRRNLAGYPPYPVYGISPAVARLNGVFNPAGPDPGTNTHGAITYRIDPRTGQYIFSRTDIKPRGVFAQNTFQHPPMPLMSALGVYLGCSGAKQGCNCKCGGSCPRAQRGGRRQMPVRFLRRANRGLSRLGADECSFDTDCGPNGVCAAGVCVTEQPATTTPSGRAFEPGGIFSDPSSFAPGPSPVAIATNTIAQGIQQVTSALNPPRVAVPQVPWYNQPTNIGGMSVSNGALAIGGVLIAALVSEKGRRR